MPPALTRRIRRILNAVCKVNVEDAGLVVQDLADIGTMAAGFP